MPNRYSLQVSSTEILDGTAEEFYVMARNGYLSTQEQYDFAESVLKQEGMKIKAQAVKLFGVWDALEESHGMVDHLAMLLVFAQTEVARRVAERDIPQLPVQVIDRDYQDGDTDCSVLVEWDAHAANGNDITIIPVQRDAESERIGTAIQYSTHQFLHQSPQELVSAVNASLFYGEVRNLDDAERTDI